jgi:hypothetical protein
MTFICALLCLLAAAACKKSADTPAPNLRSKLIGKWTVVNAIGDYTLYGVNYKDTTYFGSEDYFDFKADSTLSIMSSGVSYNGKWQIDNARLYITETNFMDFAGGFDLPVLDEHNLQIHNTDTTTLTIADQKMNFIR